jgi:thymidylate synthase (FAD)
MKIIQPSATVILPPPVSPWKDFKYDDGVKLLQHIEAQARISHRSEDWMTPDSWKKFIPAVVIQHGDWSVVEHSSVTVLFRVDRGLTHELVRHRLFSFTQESTRFVNYAKKGEELEFIKPVNLPENGLWNWEQALINCEKEYFELLKLGARPQEARSVLPNALASTIAMTGNLRNWRHLFLMRTTKESHPDMREVMNPLLERFKKLVPILYEDIEPNARQIDNLKKAR